VIYIQAKLDASTSVIMGKAASLVATTIIGQLNFSVIK